MSEVKCSICGSREVLAKIEGKYYCFKCGAKILNEHIKRQIKRMKEEGLIPEKIEI
ncbi:MAG: hypothetical protein DRJ38_04965 [Thermoprotei archaeon]|nr:MAG: hypothetical protein DRJ38_04965 [Thermoprotei archaeon]